MHIKIIGRVSLINMLRFSNMVHCLFRAVFRSFEWMRRFRRRRTMDDERAKLSGGGRVSGASANKKEAQEGESDVSH